MIFRFLGVAIIAMGMLWNTVLPAQTRNVVLTKDNFIMLRGEVSLESVSEIIMQLYTTKAERVYFFISSPGGSITAGNLLISAMKGASVKTSCVVSTAASMAFAILQQCDERLVMDSTVAMQHVASYGLEGNEPNNITFQAFIERILEDLKDVQAKRIGISLSEFKSKVRDDWWLYGAESVTQNVADRVVTVKCTQELTKTSYHQVIHTMFGDIDLTWNGCPMVEYPTKVGFSQNKNMASGEASQKFNDFLEKLKSRDYLLKYRGTDPNKKPRLMWP